jgi:hypothetical protein
MSTCRTARQPREVISKAKDNGSITISAELSAADEVRHTRAVRSKMCLNPEYLWTGRDPEIMVAYRARIKGHDVNAAAHSLA